MDLIELGKLLKNIKAKDVADLKNLLAFQIRLDLLAISMIMVEMKLMQNF